MENMKYLFLPWLAWANFLLLFRKNVGDWLKKSFKMVVVGGNEYSSHKVKNEWKIKIKKKPHKRYERLNLLTRTTPQALICPQTHLKILN